MSKNHEASNNNNNGTCMLIDVAIPGDRNVIKKETEKILKYKDLIIEIQCMWNVKSTLIPVIIGATGTISIPFLQYLSNRQENHEIKKLKQEPYWTLHTYCENR